MKNSINVIHLGAGPVGLNVITLLLAKKRVRLVGVVDINPALVGKPLISLIPQGKSELLVTDKVAEVLALQKVDVAVVTTSSSATVVAEQIRPLLLAGVSVVTTCEELSYPWKAHATVAHELDALAKQHNCSVVATGVNPGFLMDYLPCAVTAICESIESITVHRQQDAQHRRRPFQDKIGAGLTLDQFNQKAKAGVLRHVGLTESVHFIADKMGWNLTEVDETLNPVMREGVVQGVCQVAIGSINGIAKIELHFVAAKGQSNPVDRITVNGNPGFEVTFSSPVHGDVATASITVNTIASVLQAKAGFNTMLDIPTVSAWE